MTVDTFTSRLVRASPHEQAVQRRCIENGWGCWRWGQALLEMDARNALIGTDSDVRNEPDLLAIRGEQVFLIDAKSGGGPQYSDYVLEKRVLAAGQRRNATVLIVWFDFRVSDTDELNPRRPAQYNGRGSGTPMWLVDKRGRDGPIYEFDEVLTRS